MLNEGICERCENWSESVGCKKGVYDRCLDRLGVVNGINGFDVKDERPEVRLGALGCGWYVDWAGERIWFFSGTKTAPTQVRVGHRRVVNGETVRDTGL